MLGAKFNLTKKLYPVSFDTVTYPASFRLPDFVKFNGDDIKSTFEHISQYLAQLGEASFYDALKVRLFPLSLTGVAFSWFSALPPNSINTWNQLEEKFHDHFYTGTNELKLIDLTSIRQEKDEYLLEYIITFKEIKN